MKRLVQAAVIGLATTFAALGGAEAAPITGTFTIGGTTTGTGPWTMTSTDSTFAVLRLVPTSPIQFQDWSSIVYDYTAVLGGIAGGAPRVVFVVDTNNDSIADGDFAVHWGPPASFADPTLGAGNTGNLLALTDLGRYDLTNIGGSGYTDRAAALLAAGNFSVLRASLVLDSFGGNDRTFIINSVSAESVDPVPEPATLALLGTGIAMGGTLAFRRRRKSAMQQG